MGSIYRKSVTRPLPPDCKIVTRKGKLVAEWINRKGKKVTAELNEAGDRIRTEAGTYLAKYRDGDGIVCEVSTGCRDKTAAMAVLGELEHQAELVRSKILTSDQAKIADHADSLLASHIADFLEYQQQKKTHPIRVKAYETRLNESANACGFRYLRDLSPDRLSSWLADQVDGQRKMGASVYNGFVEVWVAFGNWCLGKRTKGKSEHLNGAKRLLVNPFDKFPKMDEKSDPKRKARALTESELERLLDAARRRPLEVAQTVRNGPNKGQRVIQLSTERKAQLQRLGQERALIYKTAILTGLRTNELRTLTVGDLSFGDVPFIKLRAPNEKNRRGSTLPLRSDLAEELKEWIKGKDHSSNVFLVPSQLVKIMDLDLKAAGIPKRDAAQLVVHFHSLRHSFGTHLSLAGVAPRVAQAAMRHSNISLTMNTYTDARLLDTAAAVESIGVLRNDPRTVAPTVALTTVQTGQNLSITDNLAGSDKKAENPANRKNLQGFLKCPGLDLNQQGVAPTTTSTLRPQKSYPSKSRIVEPNDEPLHQWLHQLAEIAHTEGGLEWLAESLSESLDEERRRRLVYLLWG